MEHEAAAAVDPALVLAAATALALALFVWGMWRFDRFSARGEPFLPARPFVGSALPFLLRRRTFADHLQALYRAGRARPLLGLFHLRAPALLLREPRVLRRVLLADAALFPRRRPPPPARPAHALLDKELALVPGRRWRPLRVALDAALDPRRLQPLLPDLAACALRLADRLEEDCARSKEGAALEVRAPLERFWSEALGRALLGVACRAQTDAADAFHAQRRALVRAATAPAARAHALCPRLAQMLHLPPVPPKVEKYFQEIGHKAATDIVHMATMASVDGMDDDAINSEMKLRRMSALWHLLETYLEGVKHRQRFISLESRSRKDKSEEQKQMIIRITSGAKDSSGGNPVATKQVITTTPTLLLETDHNMASVIGSKMIRTLSTISEKSVTLTGDEDETAPITTRQIGGADTTLISAVGDPHTAEGQAVRAASTNAIGSFTTATQEDKRLAGPAERNFDREEPIETTITTPLDDVASTLLAQDSDAVIADTHTLAGLSHVSTSQSDHAAYITQTTRESSMTSNEVDKDTTNRVQAESSEVPTDVKITHKRTGSTATLEPTGEVEQETEERIQRKLEEVDDILAPVKSQQEAKPPNAGQVAQMPKEEGGGAEVEVATLPEESPTVCARLDGDGVQDSPAAAGQANVAEAPKTSAKAAEAVESEAGHVEEDEAAEQRRREAAGAAAEAAALLAAQAAEGGRRGALLLALALRLLAREPGAQARAAAEAARAARALLGPGAPPLAAPALAAAAPFLDAVLAETLRLFPPAPLLTRGCVRRGASLRAGGAGLGAATAVGARDALWLPVHALQRDARHWRDPDAFRPERWGADAAAAAADAAHAGVYLPFGLGPRACAGRELSLLLAKLALVAVLSRLQLAEAPGPRAGRPPRFQHWRLELEVEGGVRLAVQRRVAAAEAAYDEDTATTDSRQSALTPT